MVLEDRLHLSDLLDLWGHRVQVHQLDQSHQEAQSPPVDQLLPGLPVDLGDQWVLLVGLVVRGIQSDQSDPSDQVDLDIQSDLLDQVDLDIQSVLSDLVHLADQVDPGDHTGLGVQLAQPVPGDCRD